MLTCCRCVNRLASFRGSVFSAASGVSEQFDKPVNVGVNLSNDGFFFSVGCCPLVVVVEAARIVRQATNPVDVGIPGWAVHILRAVRRTVRYPSNFAVLVSV